MATDSVYRGPMLVEVVSTLNGTVRRVASTLMREDAVRLVDALNASHPTIRYEVRSVGALELCPACYRGQREELQDNTEPRQESDAGVPVTCPKDYKPCHIPGACDGCEVTA
jgi:hypothetical protein